jgi:hypothetical protein
MKLTEKDKIKSCFGGLLTISTVIILLVLTWYIDNDIIYKSSPFTYIDQQIFETYPSFNLTRETFPMAIMILDRFGRPFHNESIVNIQLRRVMIVVDPVTKQKMPLEDKLIELENCRPEHFPKINAEYLYSLGLPYFF